MEGVVARYFAPRCLAGARNPGGHSDDCGACGGVLVLLRMFGNIEVDFQYINIDLSGCDQCRKSKAGC